MQRFTPPHPSETLLEAGCYDYWLNGELAGVSEPYTLHRQPNGETVLRAERLATAFQTTIGVWVRWAAGAELMTHPQQVAVQWQSGLAGQVQQAVADYQIADGRLVGQVTAAGILTVIDQPLPENALISPLVRFTQGPVIGVLRAAKTGFPVVVPDIRTPNQAEGFLTPHIEVRQAEWLHDETFTENGQTYETHCCAYRSALYDDDARFWLTAAGRLVRYISGGWEVRWRPN